MRLTQELAEEFVRAWQQADTAEEVARYFKIDVQRASVLAHYFRKKGVPLKRFNSQSGVRLSYDALARVAKKHAPK